ncbi:MAG: hypothetical protein KIT33_09130 [Candidatus Kapabacteria bacterium]|nr:hypothetical protein [Ignavibacteriota bacterium]MCW5885119.1 hypothetical protein [Candidatus Kapabacteria bacterium]
MKNFMLFLALVVFAGGIISSCSEDSNTPSKEKNLFPATNNSFWVYTRTYVNDGQTATATDSVAISGTETVKGQTASKYNVYTGGQLRESYFRYSQDSKLYSLPSELLPADILALIPAEILPQDWVVIADDKTNSWEMFTFNVDNVPVDLGGTTTTLNGVIKVTGQKGGMVNKSVGATNYSCQEFTSKISYTGKINYLGQNIDLKFEVNSKTYYADNVGLVYSETPEQEIVVDLVFSKIPVYKIEATNSALVRFSVAQ